MNSVTLCISANTHRDQLVRWCIQVHSILEEPNIFYPGFDRWYYGIFVPGVMSGSRGFIISLSHGTIAGIVLWKRDRSENKICRIEVIAGHRHHGLGKQLFEKSFDILETTKPVITIAEERIDMYRRLIAYYAFEVTDICPNYYRNNSKEYVFNGDLNVRKKMND